MLTNAEVQSNDRRGVLAAGNWIIDHVKQIDAWPAQDTLATILSQSDGNGGGPYNLLKNLAKLKCGFPLAGVGLVGNDADGESIRQDCRAHGIEPGGLLRTEDAPTSYTDVMSVTGTGRRTFFHQQGSNALFGAPHCELGTTTARIFYLGYLCLLRRLDTIRPDGSTEASQLFNGARQMGLTTIADLVSNKSADYPAIVNPSLPFLDYLFANEVEVAALCGRDVSMDPVTVTTLAQTLFERGMHGTVVVHSPEWAVCIRRNTPPLFQSAVRVPATLVAGSAGAGDAFAAGFIFGLHDGWDLPRCLELAVCVAAVSLRDVTCSAAIEPWEDCLSFGRQLGFLPPVWPG